MTPSPFPADAVAFEAAAALDGYEAALSRLTRAGAHPADFARADAEMRRLSGWSVRLPQLSAACVALLLSHYRLLAELSRRREAGEPVMPSLQMQCHAKCIARLRRQSRNLFLAAHLH